jgi:hypothetical protein
VFGRILYSFGGKLYHQQDGGPIGARVTMAASRIVMYDWAQLYRGKLEDICLWTPVLKGYVDDVQQRTEMLERGIRYLENKETFREGKFVRDENWIEEDRERDENEGVIRRMEEEMRKAMNDINPDITFTTETELDFPDGRVHTLDTDIWQEENGNFSHSYFQKEMKSPLVLMCKSAMSGQQKFSILSNELMRRLGNIAADVPHEERLAVVKRFTVEMKNSGYGRKGTREAVISGLKGHAKRRENRVKEIGHFYRTAQETLKSRIEKKLNEKTSWYKEKEGTEEGGRKRGEYSAEEWEGTRKGKENGREETRN